VLQGRKVTEVGLNKEVEFEVGNRTYRITKALDDTYLIHNLNSLTQQVSIDTDLNTGEKIFVNWSNVAILRFNDAGD
jgi:hypothetical protein